MSNRETGALGERAAAEALRAAGYELQALNWRQGRYELDIVASRDGVLHFVEVKTRQADSLTPPEAAATHRKFHALRRAASVYLATTGWQGEVQFDLAAVTVATDGATDVRLIENAMNATGDFAFPTNCVTFVRLKMKSLPPCHAARPQGVVIVENQYSKP